MANNYKAYKKGDIKNKAGGYKPRLLFAPLDTFLICALPALTAALGDKFKITTDHTFGAPDGFIGLLGKVDTATAKYTTDEDGISTHTFEIEVEGDSPELYEQLQNLKNDESVFLLKDANCIAATELIQFGDECVTPKIKVDFDAKTTAAGIKSHKITGTIRDHKYWYSGTLTEKP